MIVRILIVDPGNISGYALFKTMTGSRKLHKKLLESGCMKGNAQDDFEEIKCFMESIDVDIVLIEGQFFHPKRKSKNLIPLIENRCAWEFLAKSRGCYTEKVNPTIWQNYWKLKPNMSIESEHRRRKDFKMKIVEKARKVVRRRKITEDEADAILIGIYWIRVCLKGYIEETS